METLIVYAILCSVGYDMYLKFTSVLDDLFEKDSGNEVLLDLEFMKSKDAFLHVVALADSIDINIETFGKELMMIIRNLYENSSDLSAFAWKMYEVSNRLPSRIEYGTEPFYTLNWAGDCLSYGDEKQCRELFEKAFAYYD